MFIVSLFASLRENLLTLTPLLQASCPSVSTSQPSFIFRVEQTGRHLLLPYTKIIPSLGLGDHSYSTGTICPGPVWKTSSPLDWEPLKGRERTMIYSVLHPLPCKQVSSVECNRYHVQKDLGLNPGCAIRVIYLTSLSLIFLICKADLKGSLWGLNEMGKCMSVLTTMRQALSAQ